MRKTILSIQSHVSFGYVGNRAATFPLQCMGYEVVTVNTVQFSNHTGYGTWTGEVFSADHIADVIDGIAARGVKIDAVLSGYMGDASTGQVILDAVDKFRPEIYTCDPVMGDTGRGFFVRDGIPEFMKDNAVPTANIITPNQFELSYLAGKDINCEETALAACRDLHGQGVQTILLTSFEPDDLPKEEISMLVSHKDGSHYIRTTPKLELDPPPNGAGDATAALFLGHIMDGKSPAQALQATSDSILYLFQATQRRGERELDMIGARGVFRL